MYKAGDWYQDTNGRIFERRFDKGLKRYRWFEIDIWICGIPEGRRVERPLVMI